MLNITQIKVKKINKGELLGYASICIDDCFIVDGIKLLEGNNGRYMLMPVRRVKSTNKPRNYAYPISNEVREQLLVAISEQYDDLVD